MKFLSFPISALVVLGSFAVYLVTATESEEPYMAFMVFVGLLGAMACWPSAE